MTSRAGRAKTTAPLLAFAWSILPNTSSGHFGGARRESMPSIVSRLSSIALELNKPSSGVLETRSMGMYTPMVSVKLRLIGSCCTARHCVQEPCGAFHRKGGLVGAIGVDQFSGIEGVRTSGG